MEFQGPSLRIVLCDLWVTFKRCYENFWVLNCSFLVPTIHKQMAKPKWWITLLGICWEAWLVTILKDGSSFFLKLNLPTKGSFNRSTKKAPFEVVYGRNLNQVLDLKSYLQISHMLAWMQKSLLPTLRSFMIKFVNNWGKLPNSTSPRQMCIESIKNFKKVILSWFIFKKKDFLLRHSKLKKRKFGTLDHVEFQKNSGQILTAWSYRIGW